MRAESQLEVRAVGPAVVWSRRGVCPHALVVCSSGSRSASLIRRISFCSVRTHVYIHAHLICLHSVWIMVTDDHESWNGIVHRQQREDVGWVCGYHDAFLLLYTHFTWATD
jgi:hypothetical protein